MLSKSATFLDFQLSQGIVATYCRWGRNLCDVYIENFLINQLVNEFWKLVHICQSYCQTWRIMLFETQCIRQYRKTSDSSRAPDTGRGFKWIVPVEAGSRVQAGSGCKLGESWYLLTYRSQPALTSAKWHRQKFWNADWHVLIEAGSWLYAGSGYRPGVKVNCTNRSRGLLSEVLRYALIQVICGYFIWVSCLCSP